MIDLRRATGRLGRLGAWSCLVLLASPAAAQGATPSPAPAARDSSMTRLVRSVVDPILDDTVGTSARAYHVGEVAIVPLYAAFRRDDPDWHQHFAAHFRRLLRSTSVIDGFDELSRLQYLYFASQFLVVAKDSGHSALVQEGLPDSLFAELRSTWLDRPAVQYGHAPFHGRRESLLYRLNLQNPTKSYYRAIMDSDFFLFAIAADLQHYGGTPAQRQAWQATLGDVLSMAERVCRQEIQPTPAGGWLLQPGVWRDHPDYQYAGNAQAVSGMRPAAAPNAAWDSSHFLRAPLWIHSLMNAYPDSTPQHEFYSTLRRGLATQFFAEVLVPPSADRPCYRLNNFMDGSNGVYRWGYGSFGPNHGYGPYQVSGSMMIGTWAFLGTDRSRQLYRDLSDSYPWPKQCIELYLGPSAGGRPYTDVQLDANSSTMRLFHVLVYLASQL
jgi:hypothetical protein